ncbi:MAG TPA: diacylglycerol kinase family protein [Solirubrobacteraceae bacterium]|nr:diacylglycerol kinase family protein [Solirubrobacteraceae bacterium]
MSTRLWATVALAATVVTAVFAAVVAVLRFPGGLIVLVCFALAVVAAAQGLVRLGALRILGIALAILLLAAGIALLLAEHHPIDAVLLVAGILVSLAAARRAFQVHVRWPSAPRPAHPVLFYNPLSGGGKAQRFRVAEEARKRGIEPVELRRGDDLERLVREAVRRGSDALAMAGGDGSQAIVAMVAAEHDLPYACIPAGTRNHFALDLGVDRDDVVGALDALVDGGERRVDLAEVNGRVFVNNVSLGLYAEAVRRPGYREAKIRTLLDTVPDVMGPDAAPSSLWWSHDAGSESATAILVSNNPYRLGHAIGSGTRPRLDLGTLGIAAIGETVRGQNGRAPHGLEMHQWTAPTFQMEATEQVTAGIDGETVLLDPPLRFRVRSHALRVRIAPSHPGASPSAIEPATSWRMIPALASLAVHGVRAEQRQALLSSG